MNRILSKRLVFVSGKGGVGKTTVSQALGMLAAEQGLRCLLVEIDTDGAIPQRFGKSPGKLGQAIELQPALYSMIVEGRAALDEYLRLILPGALLRPVFGSKVYNYFVQGAPGLKELMCIGKIFYEVDRTEGDHHVWDIVIVDAPATGHGLEYFRMPQAAHDTFAVGLVHRETQRVLDLMRDPALSVHLLVTLAQELPVSETLQLHQALVEELRFPIGPIVVNRSQTQGLPPSLQQPFEAFRTHIEATQPANTLVAEIVEKARWIQAEHGENTAQIHRLRQTLGLPVVVLPALDQAQLTPHTLAPLLRSLDEQLTNAGAP